MQITIVNAMQNINQLFTGNDGWSMKADIKKESVLEKRKLHSLGNIHSYMTFPPNSFPSQYDIEQIE